MKPSRAAWESGRIPSRSTSRALVSAATAMHMRAAGENQRKQFRHQEHLGEDLLRGVDEAVPAAEQGGHGQGVAERHAVGEGERGRRC